MFAARLQESLTILYVCKSIARNYIKRLSMPIGNFLEDKDLKFENVGDVCVMIYISVQGGIIVWQLTD